PCQSRSQAAWSVAAIGRISVMGSFFQCHLSGQGLVAWVGGSSQTVAHPALVGSRTVLAELPLAFQPANRQREADDGTQHGVQIVARRIADRTELRTGRLVMFTEAADDSQEALGLFDQLQRT